MDYWNHLSQTIKNTMQTDRIGTPVFVRLTLALSDVSTRLDQHIMVVVQLTTDWLSDEPHCLYAVGSTENALLTLSLEYHSMATALISITGSAKQPHLDLTILGTYGAIYHTDTGPNLAVSTALSETTLSDQTQRLSQALTESLATNQPISVRSA